MIMSRHTWQTDWSGKISRMERWFKIISRSSGVLRTTFAADILISGGSSELSLSDRFALFVGTLLFELIRRSAALILLVKELEWCFEVIMSNICSSTAQKTYHMLKTICNSGTMI